MNIAIFHNFMDNIGGAEIVTLTLARELNAHIYTTNINTEHIKHMGFDDVLPRISSIGTIPKKAPFRQQLAFWAFRRLNLGTKHDFYIIAGDWAMSGAVHNKPNLWYVHSPLHELWAFTGYIQKNLLSFWKKPIYILWVKINRFLTLKYAKHVQKFVANSTNTKNRITKYYSAESIVIHPPTYTKDFFHADSKSYWLSVNRLTNHKRIEIQIEAFAKLPNQKLIIVGSYEKNTEQFESCKAKIEKNKTENVTLLSWVSYKKLLELYSGCTGFITTAQSEDFGMTAIEAMSAGKPVIAPNEGGYAETILHGKTGVLIDDINSEKLVQAIQQVEHLLQQNPDIYVKTCMERAKEYDVSEFIHKIKSCISEIQETQKVQSSQKPR